MIMEIITIVVSLICVCIVFYEILKVSLNNFTQEICSGGALTGYKIKQEVAAGNIKIENFDISRLGPNSYNLRIGNQVKILSTNACDQTQDCYYIDPRLPSKTTDHVIPEEGLILHPNHIYLIATEERIHTDKYIPLITGRSSAGRNGIQTHLEAGFGDIGFSGVWTLQIRVTEPTLILPGMELCQIYFLVPCGPIGKLYNGHYQNSKETTSASPMN